MDGHTENTQCSLATATSLEAETNIVTNIVKQNLPPPAIVALINESNSSSPRMANCK